jgi:O-methyltransferase involved in polyketide biosynthesis
VTSGQGEQPAEWLKDASLANHLEHPSPARVYDYLLGGHNNYAVDRMFANTMLAKMPDLRPAAVLNRRFLQRAVRFAVQQGYRQFVDIGSGLPSQGNVHEVADEAAPGATRVVYVDNEPIAHAHSTALLADTADRRRHAALNADFFDRRRTWQQVLGTKLIDLKQPVCLLTVALLHFMPPSQEPEATLAWYRDQLPSGSMLVLSHASDALDDADFQDVAASYNKQSAGNAHLRSRDEITALFGDFDLVEPGLVWAPEWQPDIEFTGDPSRSRVLAGVAIKR